MKHKLLLDYELQVAQQGYIVRALLKLEGLAPTDAKRVPLNLSIVLDRSGSMAGEKLVAAREAAAFLVRRLRPEDVISVVSYDDEVTTVAEPASGAEQAGLAREIGRIGAGGSTNLSGGWLRGRELVEQGQADGAVNRVLLLTDGQANEGIKDPSLLAGLCRSAKRAGITTSTIGFGADYDEKLLRGMADAGGGNAWYIERPDQASGVFEEEIEGLLSLSAQNVVVEIRSTTAVQLTAVHNDFPARETAKGLRLELGDIYAREPKSLLVEFFVPLLEADDTVKLADVTVHAHVLTSEGGVEKQRIRFSISTPLSATGLEEPEVRREMLLIEAARARDEALERRDRGDWEGARGVVMEMSARLSAAPVSYGAELAEQAEDLNAMAARLEPEVFAASDAKYMAQRSYNARRGKGMYEEKLSRSPRKPK